LTYKKKSYQPGKSADPKVAAKIPDTISRKLYDRLVNQFLDNNASDIEKPAIDYLQRAILHFSIYEHLIYIILNVSNDGITTKKNDTETTAWKYQTDELNDNLIGTAWFWMNLLIKYLNDHIDDFPEWAGSPEKEDYDNLPVDLSDFNKWVGVDLTGGEYFMMCAAWIIREVWLDCVCSRDADPKKTDAIWDIRTTPIKTLIIAGDGMLDGIGGNMSVFKDNIPSLTTINLQKNTKIIGSMSNLPAGIVNAHFNINTNIVGYTARAYTGTLNNFVFPVATQSTAVLDAILIDLAKANWVGSSKIILRGARSSASDASVATLKAKGVSVYINQVLQ